MVIVATSGSNLNAPTIYVEVSTLAAASTAGSDWAGDDVRETRAQKLVESTHDFVGDGVALARYVLPSLARVYGSCRGCFCAGRSRAAAWDYSER